MRRWGVARMAAAVFLLCFGWGGVLSCSNGSDNGGNNEDPNEIHSGAWKINEGGSGFVGASSGSDSNKKHNDYLGYVGAYIDGLGDGYVDYAVHSDEAQDVTILLRYAYWGYKHELRGAQIVVNGITDEDIIYCNWTNGKNATDIWQDSNEITVRLNAGDNALRIVPVPKGTDMDKTLAKYPEGADETKKTWTADGNLPNIDYLQITGNGLRAVTDVSTLPSYYGVKVIGDFGTVAVNPKQDFYAKGTEITVTATPKDGYRFDAWSGTLASNNAEWKLTVTEELNLAAHFVPSNYKASGLVGYATITDDDGAKYTISGGAGAKAENKITIANYGDLIKNKNLLASDEPKIITISGTISTKGNENPFLSEKYTVGSNTTIYGSTTEQGRLQNIEFSVEGENVIIRNMMFGEVISWDKPVKSGADDALSLNGATHVWVDHCEFQSHLIPQDLDGKEITSGHQYYSDDEDWAKDFYDGLLDIKNGSSWITISNCSFHDHWKACLCASGDGKADKNPTTGATDKDMRVTFYGNYWKDINSRQPLFRWGKAHIYNSYFNASGSDATGINCRAGSELYIENNVFEGLKTAIGFFFDVDSARTGTWTSTGNNGASNTSTTSYKPPYTWKPTSAEVAKANVVNEAGVGKLSAADLQ